MRLGSHLIGMCAGALLLAGCDHPAEQANAVVIAPENAAAPLAEALPAPAPQSVAPIEHVERVDPATLVPKAAPAPPPPMQTRKDFRDPPLPPELNQDGGLKPLPPRPK